MASLTLIVILSSGFAMLQTRSAERLRDSSLTTSSVKATRPGRENRKSLQSLADFFRERGRSLAEAGNAQGLLWLALALETAPADDHPRNNPIRAELSLWSRQISQLRMIIRLSHPVYAVAFSPDGKTVLTGTSDKCQALEPQWARPSGSP